VLAERIPVHSKFWRDLASEEGDLLYVAIGDSAAQGIGASRPDHSYVGVLARTLRAHTDRAVRVVNVGVSGSTVAMAVEAQLPRLAKLEPDIVTVSIGGNDIAGFEPRRFERDLATLLDALPPHAIVADLPSFHFLPAERKVRVANAIVRRLAAERGLAVAPLHSRTRRQGIWGVSTQFAGDLFHSNDRGYRVWASAFEPAVLARLDELDR
jgi:lysophospholipase L1-like esterase